MRVPILLTFQKPVLLKLVWGGLDILACHYIINLLLSEERFHLPAPLQEAFLS